MSEDALVNGVDKPTQVIGRVHRQLLTEFQPAIKNVSLSSVHLNKALEEVSKASEVYINSLHNLSLTGKNGEKPTQAQAQRIEKIASSLKLINAAHNKCLKEFQTLTQKIYTNNESEKDRLKALKDNFAKSEKSIHQAAKKGQKSKSEVSDFYKREMDNVVSQQAKRYQFFAEKHEDLTKSYAELGKLIVNLWSVGIEHEENHINDASPKIQHKAEKSSSTVEQDERRNDSLPSSKKQDSAVFTPPKVFDLETAIQQDETESRSHTKSTSEDRAVIELEAIIANNMEEETHHHRDSSKAQSDVSSNFILAPKETRRPSEQYSSNNRQPLVPPARQVVHDYPPYQPYEQVESKRTTVEQSPISNGHVHVIANPTYVTAPPPPPAREESRQAYSPAYQPPPAAYSPPVRTQPAPPPPRPVHIITREQEVKPLPRPQTQYYQPAFIPANSQLQQSPIPERKPAPSAKPVVEAPPPFSTADYGRELECTVTYSGSAANQLSLLAGERVVLVKSGNRGWVLGRSQDGTRTGWFPAKFLRLI